MLAAAGAPASGWTRARAGRRCRAARTPTRCAIPVGDVLGWLVAAGAGQVGDDVGASVRWLGRVAIWAVELTARGAMVPLLRQRTRRGGERERLERFVLGALDARARRPDAARTHGVETMPGSVLALDRKVDARALTRSALTGMVDAICRDGARRLEVPAPPPSVRTATDVAEAFLGRLDGSAFDAPVRIAGEIVDAGRALGARSVTEPHDALDRAARSARRRRRVAPRGVRGRAARRAAPDRAGDRDRRVATASTSKTR